MNDQDDPTAVRQEAQDLAMRIGAGRAVLAVNGQRDKTLDEAAERLTDVLMRAGKAEAKALTAAMETLDPTEFARKRRARQRMAALRGKTSKYGERS